jgi:hypothetical protein
LDYTASLEVIDLMGPRGSRRDLSEKVSGTINGSYNAVRIVENGDGTFTTEVSRTITIVITDGTSEIKVDGETFRAGAGSGELGL